MSVLIANNKISLVANLCDFESSWMSSFINGYLPDSLFAACYYGY